MHKSATKCNETLGKWCKNKHGASKIMDTFETYHPMRCRAWVEDERRQLSMMPRREDGDASGLEAGDWRTAPMGSRQGIGEGRGSIGMLEDRDWEAGRRSRWRFVRRTTQRERGSWETRTGEATGCFFVRGSLVFPHGMKKTFQLRRKRKRI
jgi:hypothetical protein